MTLRISLRDGEKVVVNGAVLCSVGRTTFCLENEASILRGREVMSEDEATTPARRLYFMTMLAYIDVDNRVPHQDQIIACLQDVMTQFTSDDAKLACIGFARHVALADFYRALADCRNLIAHESASPSVSNVTAINRR